MAELVNESTTEVSVPSQAAAGNASVSNAARPSSGQKRQAAHFVRIQQLLDGDYVKEEGWLPNYIQIDDGRKVSRINIMCSVVSKDETEQGTSVVVDDGSATILLRTFDDASIFSNIGVGQTISIIGRPREYGVERYIIPEVIKKIGNPKWIAVRQKELELLALKLPKIAKEKLGQGQKKPAAHIESGIDKSLVEGEDEILDKGEDRKEAREKAPSEKIYEMIKELGSGEGVDIQEIVEKAKQANIDGAEQLITNMISNGNIFEIRAGRIKVL